MAKTYLESTDSNFRVVNNNTTIIGTTALTDRVVIDEGITGINLGSTVEKVDFAGSLSAYQFKQGFGSAVDVYLNSVKIASITSVADKYFVFSDGSAALTYTLGKVGIGGKDITTSIAGVTGATLNTAEVSLSIGDSSGDTPTPTETPTIAPTIPPTEAPSINITSAGIYTLTSAADTVTVTSGSYDATIQGFAVGDKIDLPTSFLTTLTLSNNSGTDSSLVLQGNDETGNVITLTLAGITAASDASIYSLASFQTVFGAGSLF